MSKLRPVLVLATLAALAAPAHAAAAAPVPCPAPAGAKPAAVHLRAWNVPPLTNQTGRDIGGDRGASRCQLAQRIVIETQRHWQDNAEQAALNPRSWTYWVNPHGPRWDGGSWAITYRFGPHYRLDISAVNASTLWERQHGHPSQVVTWSQG